VDQNFISVYLALLDDNDLTPVKTTPVSNNAWFHEQHR
jgi:hypothetical protein